jgi:glutamate-1-semialdehyde 2,1-aminomutase
MAAELADKSDLVPGAAPDLTRSLEIQARARRLIPGVSQLLSKRPDQFSEGVWPGFFSEARGAEVWDLDGNRYLDMSISGIGANVLGYADPDVDAAVLDAIKVGVSSSLLCPEDVNLAEKLISLHPWADMARFARTGGEAMAIAVRIARVRTGRDKIAFCGYHGWHDWYLAANLASGDALDGLLLPGLEPSGVPRGLEGTAIAFQYNRADQLKEILNHNSGEVAAVVMEPIRGHYPEPGFLEEVRSLATEKGALLVFDEISSGLRLATGGAHLVFDVHPDIAVFSKALGNGYAIAAVIGKGAAMRASQDSFISSTNWTERVGPTAALAVLEKYERLDVSSRLVELGSQVQKGWSECAQRHDLQVEVGGIAPLSKFSFHGADSLVLKAFFVQLMLDQGFLASTMYYSMYAHTEIHITQYLEAVDRAFEEIARCIELENVLEQLRGQPAVPGFKRMT